MEFMTSYKTGPSISAEIDKPDWPPDDPIQALTLATDGLTALYGDYAVPLAVDLTVVCLDHNGQPDGNNNPTVATSYLHRRTVPGELWFSPAIVSRRQHTTTAVDHLDIPTVHAWAADAMTGQRCDREGFTVTWGQLWFRHNAVRLPPEATDIRDGEFHLRRDLGRIEYTHAPVQTHDDGTTWVYVPGAYTHDADPFDLVIYNLEDGIVRITLRLGWSVWNRPDSPGYPDIAAGLDRLTTLGWTITDNYVLDDDRR